MFSFKHALPTFQLLLQQQQLLFLHWKHQIRFKMKIQYKWGQRLHGLPFSAPESIVVAKQLSSLPRKRARMRLLEGKSLIQPLLLSAYTHVESKIEQLKNCSDGCGGVPVQDSSLQGPASLLVWARAASREVQRAPQNSWDQPKWYNQIVASYLQLKISTGCPLQLLVHEHSINYISLKAGLDEVPCMFLVISVLSATAEPTALQLVVTFLERAGCIEGQVCCLWWNSSINDLDKLAHFWLIQALPSSFPLQPPPQENTTIAEDKKKTLVDCALLMASFLQWDLATLERCSVTRWAEILASFPCLLVCIMSTRAKE